MTPAIISKSVFLDGENIVEKTHWIIHEKFGQKEISKGRPEDLSTSRSEEVRYLCRICFRGEKKSARSKSGAAGMADVPVFEIFCCRSSTDGTGTDVTSRSILHPESPWDLVLWSPGATGLHIHVQLRL